MANADRRSFSSGRLSNSQLIGGMSSSLPPSFGLERRYSNPIDFGFGTSALASHFNPFKRSYFSNSSTSSSSTTASLRSRSSIASYPSFLADPESPLRGADAATGPFSHSVPLILPSADGLPAKASGLFPLYNEDTEMFRKPIKKKINAPSSIDYSYGRYASDFNTSATESSSIADLADTSEASDSACASSEGERPDSFFSEPERYSSSYPYYPSHSSGSGHFYSSVAGGIPFIKTSRQSSTTSQATSPYDEIIEAPLLPHPCNTSYPPDMSSVINSSSEDDIAVHPGVNVFQYGNTSPTGSILYNRPAMNDGYSENENSNLYKASDSKFPNSSESGASITIEHYAPKERQHLQHLDPNDLG